LLLYLVMGIENNREYYKGYKSPFWLIEEDTRTNKAKILWWPRHTLSVVDVRTSYREGSPYPDIETNVSAPDLPFRATYRYQDGKYCEVGGDCVKDGSTELETSPHATSLGLAAIPPAPFKMKLEIPKLPPSPAPFMLDFPHPGPIADADPSIRHHVTLIVPTGFKIARDTKTLSVGLDPDTMRPIEITVGKKMVIGEREDDRIYEAGRPRPVNAGGVGLSSLNEDNGEASLSTGATTFYNRSQGHIPEPGKTYVVEMKITVFETNLPPQHMWRPKMDKVLWTGTLKTTVAQ
jgi:hypothetical protein